MDDHDDEMDRLLHEAMHTAPPELSAGFDARLMRRMRPRRLSAAGRILMCAYTAAAVAIAAWCLREVPVEVIAVGMIVSAAVAAAAGMYGRRLVPGR